MLPFRALARNMAPMTYHDDNAFLNEVDPLCSLYSLPLLSTNVKHPKFGCHVSSLCQGLRRSAGSGGEDPENQVVKRAGFPIKYCVFALRQNIAH